MTRISTALIAAMLASACGAAHVEAPTPAGPPPEERLACAGRTLEDSVPIPELGPLPGGKR